MRGYLLAATMVGCLAAGDSLNITFRYLPAGGKELVRVFVPGTMPAGSNEDWGPNTDGFISPSAPSLMTWVDSVQAYTRTYTLNVGETYLYKFHFHYDQSGNEWEWISDPLNRVLDGSSYNNSVVEISDPLFFQPAIQLDETGAVTALSAGMFASTSFDIIEYAVGHDTLDGTHLLTSDGLFYVPFNPTKSIYEGFYIGAVIEGSQHSIYSLPPLQVEKAPRPADTHLGPNIKGTEVTFVLHAPSQPLVQLRIAPSGRTLSQVESTPMQLSPDEEDIWWITVTLDEGLYSYDYSMLNGQTVSDPFARRVVDGVSQLSTEPGGTTANNYPWRSDGFVKPAKDALIIYELHIDDFVAQGSGKGRFNDLEENLDYLDYLGINAIELMPISEFPGRRSWGYNPQFHFAPEETYGTPADLKRLIDAAHTRGIAVILDIVLNHMVDSSPLWRIEPDFALNPYFKSENDIRSNETKGSWGQRDMDHFTEETQRYISSILRFWVEEYRIDGFRFDFTRGIGWDLSKKELGILGWSHRLKERDRTVYQIAEHLAADPFLISNSTLDAGWHDSFYDQIHADIWSPKPSMTTVLKQIVGLHEYSNMGSSRYGTLTEAVKSTVTHDEQSLLQEMIEFKLFSEEIALQRDLLYSTLLFTSQGIPMLWQGQEFAFQSGWTDENGNGNWDEEKLRYRPVDWLRLASPEGKKHFELYRRLIQFRKESQAIRHGELVELARYEGDRTVAWSLVDNRISGSSEKVVVVANFSSVERTFTDIAWPAAGNWYNILTGEILTATDTTIASLNVPEFSAVVFQHGQPVSLIDLPPTSPDEMSVISNYPNPFNESTIIELILPDLSEVTLTIYDVSGREAAILVNRPLSSGVHRITWNASDFRSGVYIAKVKIGKREFTEKMLLLK